MAMEITMARGVRPRSVFRDRFAANSSRTLVFSIFSAAAFRPMVPPIHYRIGGQRFAPGRRGSTVHWRHLRLRNIMLMFGGDPGTKPYRHGTHRASTRDDTIARVRPLMAPFGITRIANVTGLDRTGIPVVMVCRPNARSSAVFHGKGIDIAAAKASGLMEAIETWHAEHVQLPLRYGSLVDLRARHKLADVDDLPRVPPWRFHSDLPILFPLAPHPLPPPPTPLPP